MLGLDVVVRPIDIGASRLTVTWKMKHVVDARNVVAIDDDEVVLRILGENIDPEIYVRLYRSRTGEGQLGFRRRVARRAKSKGHRQCEHCEYLRYSVNRQIRSHQRPSPSRASPRRRALPPGAFPQSAPKPRFGAGSTGLAPIAAAVKKFLDVA